MMALTHLFFREQRDEIDRLVKQITVANPTFNEKAFREGCGQTISALCGCWVFKIEKHETTLIDGADIVSVCGCKIPLTAGVSQ